MRTRTRGSGAVAAALATVLGAGLLAGCSGESDAGPDNKITVWSLENLPPRMAATEKVVDRFEKETGITVELVGVAENQLPQLIMSAAAAGNLPDVIGAVPIGQIWQMYGNDLLDTDAATDIVDDLDTGTFDDNALKLTSDGSRRLAVPSDSWLQLLVYRKDRLEKAGLPVPDSYEDLLGAAAKLDTGGRDGISLATDPGDPFTQQSFESLALANGCELVRGNGEVDLDSPACRRTFSAYDTLARKHGAGGTQTVDTTRATYFSGSSSLLVWSSFVLDELAGLRADALPSCAECKKDPEFLADNSGIAATLKGPDGARPAQFGEVTSWAVTRTAESEASRSFVGYMMNDGYEDWFGMSPEGKIPVRTGTPGDEQKFRDAWRGSELGVDQRKPMDEVYPASLLDQLADGVTNMRRWGITQGQGTLVGATNGELPVPKAVNAMTTGQLSPEEAAHDAGEEVSALQNSLK
ncbi:MULTISPECIES: ABC transporter substrate-binding protein [unclassified Streptomyces]|uniref:ABC transporter substrate-binding protein n=1 Tax=unclassified Streptomyces TaxID=2593676 RepID=UPI000BF9D45F|nr:extracellular solute-binding protein [Streptomyces sp. Ru87]PGH47405.1 bicyclomycin resistance protein [Streptomyces sp. Ru87]